MGCEGRSGRCGRAPRALLQVALQVRDIPAHGAVAPHTAVAVPADRLERRVQLLQLRHGEVRPLAARQ